MRRKNIIKWWRRLPALVFASTAVAACGEGPIESNSLRPGWLQNQEFHLETSYNNPNVKTDRGHSHDQPLIAASLGEAIEFGESVELGDTWSDPVVWRYQVIRQGFEPDAGSDFYEYYVKGGAESPLTVIKASLDPSMNLESELVDADPKIYMVIREDRLRMAGLVYFVTNQMGERVSEAVTVDDDQMNRSYSVLSQINIGVVPHFIPPFPIAPENKDVTLEDGQGVTFTNASESSVDVVYENAIDGGLIAETWQDGMPWAAWSTTSSIESRLMDPAEIDDLGFDDHDDAEDLDYVQLLKSPLNLTEALYVDDMVGSNEHAVREEWTPWSGSWWRQSEGALVFGAAGGGSTVDTISDLGRGIFEQHAKDVQNLGEELRTLRKNDQGESEEYTTKTETYRTTQKALVDGLVKFYGDVQQAIDAGRIRMENRGTGAGDDADYFLVASANWNDASGDAPQYDAFEFRIDSMSPMDKYSLWQQARNGLPGNNPWFTGAWELLNHWSPAGSGWWGHCNGWSGAAILANEPRDEHRVTGDWLRSVDYNEDNGLDADDFHIDLTHGDQKGLLSETYYSQLSNFFGSRYNGEDDDVKDLTPKATLQILSTYVKQRGVPFVFDTTATEQVWNYPVYKYELNLTETTVGGAGGDDGALVNINTAGVDELTTLWGINSVRAARIVQYREANGPFQTKDDLVKVRGVGRGLLNRNIDVITVEITAQVRTFDGDLRVWTKNDGVGYEALDNGNSVDSVEHVWPFTLQASPAGEIISGEWDDNEKHPDFAWVPYTNTAQSGRSENGFLYWPDLQRMLPESTVRR